MVLRESHLSSPYFVDFSHQGESYHLQTVAGIPTGTLLGDDPAVVSRVHEDARLRNVPLVSDNQEVDLASGNAIGSWGIQQTYLQSTPAANFPPMNYKQYKSMLVFDQFVKNLFKQRDRSGCPPEGPPSNDDNSRSCDHKSMEKELLEKDAKPGFVPVLATNQTTTSGCTW